VHFRFNAWGEKFSPWDADEAAGGELAHRYGDRVVDAPFVLEGGSIGVDGEGTLITTEECLLHPSRNPSMSRDEIEAGLKEHLGVHTVVWLEKGLVEDRDTDGHVDLVAAFTKPGEVLLQQGPPGTEDHDRMERNREILEAAGIAVRRMPFLPFVEVAGEDVAVSHMNFYVANGGIVVPLSGSETDDEALAVIAAAYPEHEIVGTAGAVLAYGGGGPHCITQQVPAR
jgi:agmatine deiminase